MKKYLQLILPLRTIESVLAGFRKSLTELDALIADHLQRHAANRDQIKSLTEENSQIDATVRKAAKVRQNISQLIEDN